MTYNRMLLLQTCQTFAYFLIFAFADFHHDPPLLHLSVIESQGCSKPLSVMFYFVFHSQTLGITRLLHGSLHLCTFAFVFIEFVFH